MKISKDNQFNKKLIKVDPKSKLYIVSIMNIMKDNNKAKLDEVLESISSIDLKDKDGWTLLRYASNVGNINFVNYLLSKGANPNIQDNNGWTPLHEAVYYNKAIVEALLQAGANPNIQNRDGWTSLHCACETGNGEIIKDLLNNNADTQIKNKNGKTPKDVAQFAFVKALIEEYEQNENN